MRPRSTIIRRRSAVELATLNPDCPGPTFRSALSPYEQHGDCCYAIVAKVVGARKGATRLSARHLRGNNHQRQHTNDNQAADYRGATQHWRLLSSEAEHLNCIAMPARPAHGIIHGNGRICFLSAWDAETPRAPRALPRLSGEHHVGTKPRDIHGKRCYLKIPQTSAPFYQPP